MKSNCFIIFLVTFLVPLAQGRPFPPHHHRGVRGVVGKKSPHLHRRDQEDLVEKSKKNDDGRIEDCVTMNPLSRFETGCPCFTPETLMNQMDYASAESCELFQGAGVLDFPYEFMDFLAYASQDNPDGTFTTQQASFMVGKDSDLQGNANETYCYISLHEGKYTGEYGTDAAVFGEDHSYNMDISNLTDDEYGECVSAMTIFKDRLPSNCFLHESGY